MDGALKIDGAAEAAVLQGFRCEPAKKLSATVNCLLGMILAELQPRNATHHEPDHREAEESKCRFDKILEKLRIYKSESIDESNLSYEVRSYIKILYLKKFIIFLLIP
jgi:hypothetical protein